MAFLFNCLSVIFLVSYTVNLSTCQPVNLSTCQPVNLSTCQPVNLSDLTVSEH